MQQKAPVFRKRNTPRARDLRNEASPAERKLWAALCGKQLNGFKFTRQFQIGPYFVDFLCRGASLVIELDGFSHELTPEADAVRTEYLQAKGFAVIRFQNQDVFENLDGVLVSISAALSNRPTPSPSRKREGS